MSFSKHWVSILLAMATGFLVLLHFCPQTGWLLRAQFGDPQLSQDDITHLKFGGRVPRQPLMALLQSRQWTDYEGCLLKAIHATPVGTETESTARMRALWAMVPQFGNQPGLYAHILRFYSLDAVRCIRAEDWLISCPTVPPGFKPTICDPKVLALFDWAAAAGEKLDPDNAFFPHMRAGGLLAGYQDKKAIKEILRAGQLSGWEDYVREEAEAYEVVCSEAGHHPTVMEQEVVDADILTPHYGLCRAAARTIRFKAVQAEASGNRMEGLALRHALMKVGSAMRYHSGIITGSLIGIAIIELSLYRPGGAPIPSASATGNTEAAKQARWQEYYHYLTSIHQTDEVRWVQGEEIANQRVRSIALKARGVSVLRDGGINRLVVYWLVDMILLANALWLLLLGGMAALRMRRSYQLILFAVGSIAIVILGIWTWQAHWITFDSFEVLFSEADILFEMTDGMRLGIFVLSLAAPLLLIIGAVIRSFHLQKTVGRYVVGALQNTAPALAAMLLIGYAGMVVLTARLESSIQADTHRLFTQGNRVWAEKAHQEWPGP